MKKIITFLLLVANISFANTDDCDKCFKKEKKSKKKSTVFSQEKLIETKPYELYNEYKRDIFVQFKKTEKNYIVLRQQTWNSITFKRPIVLGTAIKIAFKFDNGENYILTFDANENVDLHTSDLDVSSNEKIIDDKLGELLKNNKVSSMEILNPCNDINQSRTIQQEVAVFHAEKIKEVYNCFLIK